jgi:GAF domain-containing protein
MQMEWPLQSRYSQNDNHQSEEVLSFVLEQAMLATKASGAAIALSRGKEIVCRAAQGTAPDVGMRLESRWGFSGLCLQKGRVLLCDDAELDPRVDHMACRQLGVRSIIAAPLFYRGKPVGVLEVLSTNAQAFVDGDIQKLELLSKIMIEALTGMQGARREEWAVAI